MKNTQSDSSFWQIMSVTLGILGLAIFKSPLFLIFGLLASVFFTMKG